MMTDATQSSRRSRQPHTRGTFGYLWTGALVIASTAPAVVGYIEGTVGAG
jgi:hypothetical protein